MTSNGPPGRQQLRRRLLIGVVLGLVGIAGFAFWQLRIEPRVGEVGAHLLSTDAGQGLVAAGVPEDLIRESAHCSSGTFVQDCSVYLIPHSTTVTLRVDVGGMRSLGGRWEGSQANIDIGETTFVAASRKEDWGSIGGSADYDDITVWIEADGIRVNESLVHQYVSGQARVSVEGAEHGNRPNTYSTFNRAAERDLTLFVLAPEEQDAIAGTTVDPIVSSVIALGSIFAAWAGIWLAWNTRGRLRDLGPQ